MVLVVAMNPSTASVQLVVVVQHFAPAVGALPERRAAGVFEVPNEAVLRLPVVRVALGRVLQGFEVGHALNVVLGAAYVNPPW